MNYRELRDFLNTLSDKQLALNASVLTNEGSVRIHTICDLAGVSPAEPGRLVKYRETPLPGHEENWREWRAGLEARVVGMFPDREFITVEMPNELNPAAPYRYNWWISNVDWNP